MIPITPGTIMLANFMIDMLIKLFVNLSGPKADDLRAALIASKVHIDEVGNKVAEYKVTY